MKQKINIETIREEINKRPPATRYIVSGMAHDGNYRFTLFNIKIGKVFLTGTNDLTKAFTINAIMLDTIKSITAIDWNRELHEEIKTKIY